MKTFETFRLLAALLAVTRGFVLNQMDRNIGYCPICTKTPIDTGNTLTA